MDANNDENTADEEVDLEQGKSNSEGSGNLPSGDPLEEQAASLKGLQSDGGNVTSHDDTTKNKSNPAPPAAGKWIPPNLYQECATGLLAAFLMFMVPDLRQAARQGQLEGDDSEQIKRLLELPVSLKDLSALYSRNKDMLTQLYLKDQERAQMYEDALTLVFDKDAVDESQRSTALENTFLVAFDDVDPEENCVYAITYNLFHHKIGVYFRGSVTRKDFRQDAKAVMSLIDNPASKFNPDLPEDVLVHHGFKEYLYRQEKYMSMTALLRRAGIEHSAGDTAKQLVDKLKIIPIPKVPVPKVAIPKVYLPFIKKKDDNADRGNDKDGTEQGDGNEEVEVHPDDQIEKKKYEIILDQVAALCAEYPNCRLHIGGHSLGGALATLLSFHAACDERIPSPVTNITSGAPKVGNLDFLRAYDYLEQQGRVRCIQVANNRDPVPLSPPNNAFNPFAAIFCQLGKFRHVGLQMKLRRYGYIITYPMKMVTYCGTLFCDMMQISRALLLIAITVFSSLLCLSGCFIIAVPALLCYCCRSAKDARQHHTQLKYFRRLQRYKPDLEQLHLDQLNKVRWKQNRWRVPVLHTFSQHQMYCSTLDCFYGNLPLDNDKDADFDEEKQSKDASP
jgi:hypothetical protein